MISGLRAATASKPKPILSIAPDLKFSTKTSAVSASVQARSGSVSLLRLSLTERTLALSAAYVVVNPRQGGSVYIMNSFGASILMTVAPNRANNEDAQAQHRRPRSWRRVFRAAAAPAHSQPAFLEKTEYLLLSAPTGGACFGWCYPAAHH